MSSDDSTSRTDPYPAVHGRDPVVNYKAIRGGHKAYATKIVNDAKALTSTPSPENKIEISVLYKVLNERIQKIELLDEAILSQLDDDNEIQTEIMSTSSNPTDFIFSHICETNDFIQNPSYGF